MATVSRRARAASSLLARPLALGKQTAVKGGAFGALQSTLVGRDVSPAALGVRVSRTVESVGSGFGLELGLMRGGHVLRFATGQTSLTEVVTARTDILVAEPLASCACASDDEAEYRTPDGRVSWMTSVQTEQLPAHLYPETVNEMDEVIAGGSAMVHRWADEDSDGLSLLDVQRYPHEVHVQAYHLSAAGGIVVRTQSLFELVRA